MARTKKETKEPARRSERIEVAKAVERSKHETTAKVTKPKRFRRPRQRKSCRLLALPGELRNKIYSYALIEPEAIQVTSKGPGQPSLLQVCRTIRTEAKRIYYGDNDFVLHIVKYNGADFLPFSDQFYIYRGCQGRVCFRISGGPDWDNLVAWVKAYDQRYSMIPDVARRAEGDDLDHNDHIMYGAFEIVDAMKWMPWAEKEKALKGYYHGLRGTCSNWVKAEDRVGHY